MPTANAGRSGFTRPVLTRRQLSIGWSARQSPFAQAAAAKTHQATIARSWGTTPGLNFVYAHLNRAIRARDLNVINTQSEMAAAYALPRSITAQGVRRYGFHGLSYEYIASVLPDVLGPVAAEDRVVIAPLAAGPACMRCAGAEAWQRPWASPRSTAFRLVLGVATWIQVSSSI